MKYSEYIQKNKDIICMIHVKALSGTPNNNLSPDKIIEKAVSEAKTYKELGIKTVMIENMHDTPYIKNVGPEVVSIMAVIGKEIKKFGLYCGVQILSNSNKKALAVAHAAGLDFVRCEGFVYAHIGDEGLFESSAGELLRYRKKIGAENLLIFTDIKKKHSSHAITSDVSILETAETAKFFLSDGIVITGEATGEEADINELENLKDLKIIKIIGSGINVKNLEKYFNLANIFIVGSTFKEEGLWSNDIEPKRVKNLLDKFNQLKDQK